MKFALGEIRLMKDSVGILSEKTLPLKVSWKLNKLIKEFDKELIGIEEARVALVRKYGKVDEQGNTRVPDDSMPDFLKEFNEFLNEEVEIEYDPIDVNLVQDLEITAKELMLMEKLFK